MAKATLHEHRLLQSSVDAQVNLTREYVVVGEHGLTMLCCSQLQQHFEQFEGTIQVSHGAISADGRSMIDLLQLRAKQGAVLSFHVTGTDSERLLQQVESILSRHIDRSKPR